MSLIPMIKKSCVGTSDKIQNEISNNIKKKIKSVNYLTCIFNLLLLLIFYFSIKLNPKTIAIYIGISYIFGQYNKIINIFVVGHGGRDTTLFLNILQSINSKHITKLLHKFNIYINLEVLSCSFPQDNWENTMNLYLKDIESNINKNININFIEMKFGEDPCETKNRLNQILWYNIFCIKLPKISHVIQCEQGVDLFVDVSSNKVLQDNYEDNIIHFQIMEYCKKTFTNCSCIQTNTELDIGRGIDTSSDPLLSLFNCDMRINEFDNTFIFVDGKKESVTSIAIKMGLDPSFYFDKFKIDKYIPPYDIFSLGFTCKSAELGTQHSVAQGIETIIANKDKFDFVDPSKIPSQQFTFSEFNIPSIFASPDIYHQNKSLLKQNTFPEWIAHLMELRKNNRLNGIKISTPRLLKSYWMQLNEAEKLVKKIKNEHPNLNLNEDNIRLTLKFYEIICNLNKSKNKYNKGDSAKKIQKNYKGIKWCYRLLTPSTIMFLDWVIMGIQENNWYETESKIIKNIEGERSYDVGPSQELEFISDSLYKSLDETGKMRLNG